MRAFVALDLPDGLLRDVTRLQSGLGVGRVVAEENLHLTLAFLGEISHEQMMDMAEGLATLNAAPVALSLAGLDTMGGDMPRVLAIRAEPTDPLISLQKKVSGLARDAGLTLQRRRFRPHVTLSRLPRKLTSTDERRLGEFLSLNGAARLTPYTADTLTLYRSHLRDDGASYEPLAEALLAG